MNAPIRLDRADDGLLTWLGFRVGVGCRETVAMKRSSGASAFGVEQESVAGFLACLKWNERLENFFEAARLGQYI